MLFFLIILEKHLIQKNQVGNSYTYITTLNLYWNRFELTDLKQMLFTDAELEKCTVKKGDLLVCEGGDIVLSSGGMCYFSTGRTSRK